MMSKRKSVSFVPNTETYNTIKNENKINSKRRTSLFELPVLGARKESFASVSITHKDEPLEDEDEERLPLWMRENMSISPDENFKPDPTSETKLKISRDLKLNLKNLRESMKSLIIEAFTNQKSVTFKEMVNKSKTLCDDIKLEFKSQLEEETAYRILVTSTHIKGEQFSGYFASRFLWNNDFDNFIEFTYKLEAGFIIFVAYFVRVE